MGTRGSAPKDPRRRQRRADPKGALQIVAQLWVEAPKPRVHWLLVVKREWEMLWGEALHAAFFVTDVPELVRLFDLKDERERTARAIRKGVIVEGPDGKPKRVSAILVPGSTSNMVLNPLLKLRSDLDAEILALADRFALNLKARLSMNVDLTKLAKAMEQLNRSIEEDDDEDEEQPDEADPRLTIVVDPPHRLA